MMVAQEKAEKGSQKWVQHLINACPALLNARLRDHIPSLSGREIRWVSPLARLGFAEYQDAFFLSSLNLEDLTEALSQFWPRNGPRWDALGKTTDDRIFLLIEAKANVPEMVSTCKAKDERSIRLIAERLAATRQWLDCQEPLIDWQQGFYQYANRLAHLYFLREKQQKEAYLIFLYFVDDQTHIPTSRETWDAVLQLQKQLLGLSPKNLGDKVVEIFLHTKEIESHPWRDFPES